MLISGGVQRGVIVKKASKNTSVDVLNLDEGSIPFTRSIFLLSKFAVFQATVIRVSYEAARVSPVSLGFQPRNRNRGSGADHPTDGLALFEISCRKKTWCPHALIGGGVRGGGCFPDSSAPLCLGRQFSRGISGVSWLGDQWV